MDLTTLDTWQVSKVVNSIDHMRIELTLYYYIMIAIFLLHIIKKGQNQF